MSLTEPREMTEKNLAAHQANGQKSRGPVTPRGKVNSSLSNLRHGFYAESRAEVLAALGEEPEQYLELMESLQDDLAPRGSLEVNLVKQMGESLWSMERARRMQEGQALKRLEVRVLAEQKQATELAADAFDTLQPFQQFEKALARRAGPTPEEIEEFVEGQDEEESEEAKELFDLLDSLKKPGEEKTRKDELRQARRALRKLMEQHESVAWHFSRQLERVHWPENLAALMAPMEGSQMMQRMEDSNVRRLWRLTTTLIRIRQGGMTQKDVKNADRSGYVAENKGQHDTMSDGETDILGNSVNG